MAGAPSYGSHERRHCRPCRVERAFLWAGADNHDRPCVHHWRCTSCGNLRMAMADVEDAEGLVRTVLDPVARRAGMNRDEYEDSLASMFAELADLYARWDPTAGVRFRAYGIGLLRLRVNNLFRAKLGRDVPKAHEGALSVEALTDGGDARLGSALSPVTGDPEESRPAGLLRALSS